MKPIAKRAEDGDYSLEAIVIVLLAGVAGTAALGNLIGGLIGQSGADSTVTAAAITSILTVLGGALVFSGVRGFRSLQSIAMALIILTFYSTYSFAVQEAHSRLIYEAYANRQAADEAHLRHLEACSKAQSLFNKARAFNELEPLGAEYFCRKPPGHEPVSTLALGS